LLKISAGLPESSAGLPKSSAELPEGSAGLPESFAGLPESSARLPGSSAGLPKSSASAETFEIYQKTNGLKILEEKRHFYGAHTKHFPISIPAYWNRIIIFNRILTEEEV
jgi:hypothetical protein